MKSTGIVRKVDELGRVVIPKELRKTYEINVKDPLEIYVDGNKIVLQKYTPGCIFCASVQDVICVKGKYLCTNCLEQINNKVG